MTMRARRCNAVECGILRGYQAREVVSVMTIQCTIVPVTQYQHNCSIIKCEASGKAAIVDPGGDIDRILGAVEQMGATVDKLILRHALRDH